MQPQPFTQTSRDGTAPVRQSAAASDHSVRDYIYTMSQELAQMARWDGDEALAVLLEAAMSRASVRVASPG